MGLVRARSDRSELILRLLVRASVPANATGTRSSTVTSSPFENLWIYRTDRGSAVTRSLHTATSPQNEAIEPGLVTTPLLGQQLVQT